MKSRYDRTAVVTTNVKQGALIGAITCFAIGILLMFVSLWSFIVYSPLLLVAFILSIVAMSQKRVAGGLIVLLLTLILPPIIFISLAAVRGGKAAEKISESLGNVQRELETEWDRSEYENVVSQINSLRERQGAAAASASLLSRIVVADPKFYWLEADFIFEPVIDMQVRNHTGQALSRLFFRGTVRSPGRTMAWIDEDFNYTIQGGIEHGEEKHLRLSPNTFGPWGNRDLRERTDLVFTVAVVNAHDANGQRLAEEFGQSDIERLESLMTRKSELESRMQRR